MSVLAGLDALVDRRVIASISGGKDSTAMGLALQAAGVPFTPVFLDTGWETPWTYKHIREDLVERFGPIVERRAQITLPPQLEVTAQGFEARLGHYSAMVRLCLKKGMFPSRVRRVCTQVLKVFTMRDFLAELALRTPDSLVNAVGIRREESAARSLAPVWSTSQTYQAEIWHPLALWTEADVIAAHHAAGLRPNPHYLAGSERVGCLPCIHARKSEISSMGRHHPERVELLADLEEAVANLAEARAAALGTTLEARGHHRPAWFQSRKDDRRWVKCPDCGDRAVLDDDDCYARGPDDAPACATCGGEGKVRTKGTKTNEMWPIRRVVEWSKTDRKGELFAPEPHEEGCVKWGLCDVPSGVEFPRPTVRSACATAKRGERRAAAMYVKQVQTNAKVGADVVLGERTLIVGPNGSGKSTIVNAIELALTGRASDIAGKDVSVLGDLLALAPGRAGELWAYATFSNDEAAVFRLHGKDGRASLDEHKRPAVAQHDGVLPVRVFAEHFGSVDKARKFLVERAGAVTVAAIVGMLPEQLRKEYTDMVAAIGTNQPGTATADLAAVITHAGTLARQAKAESKRADASTETTHALPVSEAEITTGANGVKRARAAIAAGQEIAARNELRKTLDLAIEEARERLEGLDHDLAGKHERANAIVLLLDRAVEKAFPVCPLCSQGVNPDSWETRAIAIERQIAKLPPMTDGEDAVRVESALDSVTRKRDELGDYEELVPSLAVREGALKSAEAFQAELVKRQEAWTEVQRTRTKVYGHASNAQTMTNLVAACEAAATSIVNQAIGAFSAQVQAHLPAGDVFKIQIGEGTRDVVRYGFVRDGILHTALSGAEWARMTAAIAAAIAGDGAFAVIIPEERAWDPTTLRDVMVAFNDVQAQIILVSPIPPAGRKPKGWTIVECSRSVARPPSDDDVEAAAAEVRGMASQLAKAETPVEPASTSFEEDLDAAERERARIARRAQRPDRSGVMLDDDGEPMIIL